jgi:ABC-type cobalamin/Fe3+-siderophores transport system ATPase subunit
MAPELTTPAIEALDLVVRLGGAPVLDSVSVAVQPGQLVVVVGPNGAGKSTLLRCLDGLLRPSSGEVRVGAMPVAALSRRDLARLVSYVPQVAGGLGELSVASFVELGRYPHLGPWQELGPADRAAVDEALELTETVAFAARRVDTLSGGERQRVLIAAALAQGGRILLLDEPTTYLDYRHQVQVVELLERLHAVLGLTVIMVTHDLNAGAAAADLVLALKAGRVAYRGVAAGLLDPVMLESVFETPFSVLAAGQGGPAVLPLRRPR